MVRLGGARRGAGRDAPRLHALSRPGPRDRGDPAEPRPRRRGCRARLRRLFEATYARLFGRTIPRLEVEALTWTLSLATDRPLPQAASRRRRRCRRRRRPAAAARSVDPATGTMRRPRSMTARRCARAWAPRPGADRRGRDHHRGAARLHRPRERPRPDHPGGWHEQRCRAGRCGPSSTTSLADIRLQVMWNRLLSVVEEQARTLVRTAFSTAAREAGDISAGVFDLEGRMLAQAVTGTPGHVNSMARSVVHFIREFPVETMRPGDHYRHQRSLEGHRPSLRHRRHLARLPRGQAGGAVLLHHPCRRHRRLGAVAGRPAGLPRRACSCRCCPWCARA